MVKELDYVILDDGGITWGPDETPKVDPAILKRIFDVVEHRGEPTELEQGR